MKYRLSKHINQTVRVFICKAGVLPPFLEFLVFSTIHLVIIIQKLESYQKTYSFNSLVRQFT